MPKQNTKKNNRDIPTKLTRSSDQFLYKKKNKERYHRDNKNDESFDEKMFSNQLLEIGFEISIMDSDGNCMFR